MLNFSETVVAKQRFADTSIAPGWVRPAAISIATCFAYFLSARLGLFLLTQPDGVAVFWPAAGVSSGMLIAMGRGARWPVVAGTIAATIAANLTSDRTVWAALAFGLCNAAEAVVAAWLIERSFGSDFHLGKLRYVAGFLAAAMAATAVSGVGGAVAYRLFHVSSVSAFLTWQHWFISDAIGIITVAPVIIGLSGIIREPPKGRELSEGTAGLLAVVAITGAIIFLLPGIWWDIVVPVELLFPLLLWITARCRPTFTSAAVFVISLMIVSAVTFQFGHFGSTGTPLDDRILGAQVGILGVAACAFVLAALFEERRHQETVLIDSEGRMRAIINTVVDAIITIDDRGTVETLNPAAARVFGYSPEEVVGHNVKMLMPEPYCREHDDYIRNYLRTGQAKVVGIGREVVGQRKDGSTFPMDLAVSEMTVAGRRMFTGVVRDITERKRAEEHRELLVAELDHRVKNILAQVAVSTRRGSSSMDAFVRSLDGRIQSMAAAHRLLSESSWQRVGLATLVRSQLAPYTADADANIAISGANVMLTAPEIQAVAMVLHELVTNAAKHGALSVPNGRVSVSWQSNKGGSSAPSLTVDWREIGGPSVVTSGQHGYGTILIRDLIPHELGGTVDLAFAAEGVTCKIEFPLEQSSSIGLSRAPAPVTRV